MFSGTVIASSKLHKIPGLVLLKITQKIHFFGFFNDFMINIRHLITSICPLVFAADYSPDRPD